MKKLNNDDLQERWKSCISVVCLAMPHVDKAIQVSKDFADKLTAVIRDLVEKVKHIFSTLKEMCDFVGYDYEELCDKVVSNIDRDKQTIYPQGYPQYVHNLKLNNRGYPRPVFRCARSRC